MPDNQVSRGASGRNVGITYADYLKWGTRSGGGDAGESGPAMSEEQWNRLADKDKWALVSGGFGIDPSDPRYADLAGRVKGEAGRGIVLQGSAPNDSDFVDPSGNYAGNGFYAHNQSNETPQTQARVNAGGLSDKEWAALVASMFGGAALAGGALGGAGAEAAGGGLGSGLEGAGITADASMGAGAGASGAADFSGLFTGGEAAGGAGGLAGLGQAAGSGALQTIPESALGTLPMAGASGGSAALANLPAITQAGAGPGLISQGVSALGGPGNVARLGLGAVAALGGGSSGNGSSGGANTDVNSIIEQMARANRVNQTTPIGSRTWSQDPTTGQWSVNDAMSAPEQANFTNVQGMNADVTGMARQRLAAMLARPAAQRYDRPLGS